MDYTGSEDESKEEDKNFLHELNDELINIKEIFDMGIYLISFNFNCFAWKQEINTGTTG